MTFPVPCSRHESGGRLGQHPLFLKTAPLAGDPRPVGQRRLASQPLPARGRQRRRFGEPPVGLAGLTPEVQARADRPARQWPPRRPGALKLGRPAGIVQLGADISPREAGPQHRQARLARAETVRQRPRAQIAQIAQPFGRRDGQCRLLPPGGQRQHPRLDQEQLRVTVQYLAGEPLQPGQDGVIPARVGVADPAALDQLGGLGVGPGCYGVLDRLAGRAVVTMPGVRAAVQHRGQARLAPLELHPQQLREQVVEAVPAALVIEPDQEQVGPRQRVEHRGRALLLQHGIAQGTRQPVQNRRAEHQRLHRRVMRVEHFGDQEIDHVPVRAAESAHQSVPVGGVLQRQRRQIEPGRPSLRLPGQPFDIPGREAEPEAAVQEGVRLLGGEPQVIGSQLEQLAVSAQRRHRQHRLRPAREHELEPGRRMVDEPPDTGAGRDARQPVKVIQDQCDLTHAVQLVDQARNNHLHHRCHHRTRRHRVGHGRAGTAQRLDHIRPQHHRVVVALIQRQPPDRFPRGLGLTPRRQQGRLPETRRTSHQRKPAIRPAPKTCHQALPRNRLLPHRRRMQLRAHQDQPLRTLPHPAARSGARPFSGEAWPSSGALTSLRHRRTARPGCSPHVAERLLRRAHRT